MRINSNSILSTDIKESKLLSEWLNHKNSLTDKLLSAKGSVDLELLSQKWVKPTWWDNYLLPIKSDLLFQREIMMRSQNIDYWYARTIIPQQCYSLNPKFFYRLEHESIRNLIFGNEDVERVNMACYTIDKQCIEFHWVKKYINTLKGTLWVRFAEFSFQRLESFYLMEILLPELENTL